MVGPRTSEFSPAPPVLFVPPPPETVATAVADFDLPRSPKRLRAVATDAGWSVDATYSRGPWLYVSGEDFKWCHNVTLRFARGEQRAGAIWLAKATQGEYAAGSVVIPEAGWEIEAIHIRELLEPTGSKALETYLKEEPRAPH